MSSSSSRDEYKIYSPHCNLSTNTNNTTTNNTNCKCACNQVQNDLVKLQACFYKLESQIVELGNKMIQLESSSSSTNNAASSFAATAVSSSNENSSQSSSSISQQQEPLVLVPQQQHEAAGVSGAGVIGQQLMLSTDQLLGFTQQIGLLQGRIEHGGVELEIHDGGGGRGRGHGRGMGLGRGGGRGSRGVNKPRGGGGSRGGRGGGGGERGGFKRKRGDCGSGRRGGGGGMSRISVIQNTSLGGGGGGGLGPSGGSHSPDGKRTFEDKLGNTLQCIINSAGQFKCPLCSTVRKNKHCLKYHYNQKHVDSSLHKCGYCNKILQLSNESTISQHVQSCHEHDEHCRHLQQPTRQIQTLGGMHQEPSIALYSSCKLCNKSFDCGDKLSKHMNDKHPGEVSAGVTEAGTEVVEEEQIQMDLH